MFDLTLLVFLALVMVPAATGAIFKPGTWYFEELKKPWWRPPAWLFPPVWGVLYLMIAVSGWLIWREAGWQGGTLALVVYGLQLVFNGLWSPVFFGLRRPDWAFVEILFLWSSIVVTIVLFQPISPLAAWLLVPYLGWASFAGLLNFTIMRMNPRSGVARRGRETADVR